MSRNLDCRRDIEIWAEQNGFSLRINNGGHHWIIQKGQFVAEWWPSSAKLVLNRDYRHDRQVYDWQQVRKELEQLEKKEFETVSDRLHD